MRTMSLILSALCVLMSIASAAGPYAPAAGQAGSTAIHMDDPVIAAWATGASVVRGLADITNPAGGDVNYGDASDALGNAEGTSYDVVSLGDGGSITLTFESSIVNGEGYDFAVFENGVADTVDPTKVFLELGFVEVSSDGVNFTRFPAVSLTQTDTQVDGFGVIDPTNLYNFAGKYAQGYGTPFDMDELTGSAGLDVNHITHVRIIDVVGNIDSAYCTYDSQSHAVNDPWNTPFPTGGFDLDAVGVIHQSPEPATLMLLVTGGLLLRKRT
jgi:hypothetical protein